MTTAATMLTALGWRTNSAGRLQAATRDFQRGWNLGTALTVDGIVGPKTAAALAASYARLRAGKPTASAHFSFREFACKCGGRYASCARIRVHQAHLDRLEVYRSKIGRGVSIVSGYRCEGHNRAVGGASSSQHLYGAASDIAGVLTLAQARGLRLFAGLGYQASTGRVIHVDSRDVSGNNTTRSSASSPSTWRYA